MKSTNEFDYRAAIAASLASSYSPVSVTGESEEGSQEIILHSKNFNPEIAAIKLDNFEKLSDEAKQIIMLIVWGPIDFFENIETEHFRKVTMKKIRSYFGKQYGKRKTTSAITEIKNWVNDI